MQILQRQRTLLQTSRVRETFVSMCNPVLAVSFGLTCALGGESAVERSSPADCVPGFTCAGPGVFGFYLCVADTGYSS